MKAKLNYFSLLLFSNVSRFSINDLLGVEIKQRLSGGIMLVLALLALTGGNIKTATNYVYSTNGSLETAAINNALPCSFKNNAVSACSEYLIISKSFAIKPATGAASSYISCLNESGTAGLTNYAINTNAGFINFSEREII